MRKDTIPSKSQIQEVEKENRALRLLLDWAVDSGFGYENLPEEYQRLVYLEDYGYREGLIAIARKVLEENL